MILSSNSNHRYTKRRSSSLWTPSPIAPPRRLLSAADTTHSSEMTATVKKHGGKPKKSDARNIMKNNVPDVYPDSN